MAQFDNPDDYVVIQDFIVHEETPQADALGELLLKHLNPRSVFDIGCGPGIYLLPFQKADCEVFGVDGCSAAGRSLTPETYRQVDLRAPWADSLLSKMCVGGFDLALCIEVAEHLRPEYASFLVYSATRISDTVFWSAARPGQGGHGHFNEQPKSYWINLFANCGYKVHPDNGVITRTIDEGEAYAKCGWLRNNSILFQRII